MFSFDNTSARCSAVCCLSLQPEDSKFEFRVLRPVQPRIASQPHLLGFELAGSVAQQDLAARKGPPIVSGSCEDLRELIATDNPARSMEDDDIWSASELPEAPFEASVWGDGEDLVSFGCHLNKWCSLLLLLFLSIIRRFVPTCCNESHR